MKTTHDNDNLVIGSIKSIAHAMPKYEEYDIIMMGICDDCVTLHGLDYKKQYKLQLVTDNYTPETDVEKFEGDCMLCNTSSTHLASPCDIKITKDHNVDFIQIALNKLHGTCA